MKKLLLFLPVFLFHSFSNAQTVEITANLGTSATPGLGTSNYVANEAIYTDAEIGASNFTTAGSAIQYFGFNVYTVGSNTTFNNVSIYMKDVPSTTTTFSAGTYSNSGYTLVYSGSVTLSTTGFTDVLLNTPYTRTPGTNLQVLVTRTDNATHSSYVWACANGNNVSSTANTTRRYNSTAALSGTTSLAVSAFRGSIRLKHIYNNDVSVNALYMLGKVPMPNGATQPISASITNTGLTPLTNLDVTLDISGANSYNSIQTIPSLAVGATTVVAFPPITFSNTGNNTVVVSVPSDDYTGNDSKTAVQQVNTNTWSYAYGSTPAGGVGFTGATGDFVARFNNNTATFISQISVNFSAGGQPFKIGIWDASGAGGTPGTLLWESASSTSTAGVFVMPVTPFVAIGAGDFFVGVRQTGTTNVSFSYQTETPIRTNTFYFTSPTGGTTWTDFAPANSFRFMIEPKLILPYDASISSLSFNGSNGFTCTGNTQQVSATISNTGANPINPGTASVTLKISGANAYTSTLTNNTMIASGGTETVLFTGISLPNPGTNNDTAYVTLSGDTEQGNDTTRTSQLVLNTINSLPATESFDNASLIVGSLTQLSGTGNWALQSGAATNAGLSGSLNPHSSSKFAIFNSYSFASGTISRLFSNCINMPASAGSGCTANMLGFWMSQDNSYSTSLDSIYVSVSADGGVNWTRILPGFGRYNASFTTPGWVKKTVDLSAYAGQSIQIGFEAISKFGNIIGLDDIMIGSTALQNIALSTAASNSINLVQACDDAGWTYYMDPSISNTNLIAIKWDPNNTGANVAAKAVATARIQVDGAAFNVQNTGAQAATFTMKRYWNVDLNGGTLTSPVNVRFFYDSSEVAEVTTAVSNFITANGGTAETPTWFKTNGTSFSADAAHMDEQGVFSAIPLTNVNTTNDRFNGIPYAQFNGISSFSGGTYAAGVGVNTPLPTSLLAISARNAGEKNVINWTMATGADADYFFVEKSVDGRSFKELQKVEGSKQTEHEQSYTAYDFSPEKGINYYRVKTISVAGNITYSKIVSVHNDNMTTVDVYPNPVKDVMHIAVNAAEETDASLLITDVTGKTVFETKVHLQKGANTITPFMNEMAKGTYFVKLITSDANYVHKFNVQ